MIFNPKPQKLEEQECVITITGKGSANKCYVTISGRKYISTATVAVPPGSKVYCYARGDTGAYSTIYENKRTIGHVPGDTPVEYTYLANQDTTIDLYNNGLIAPWGGQMYDATITITY